MTTEQDDIPATVASLKTLLPTLFNAEDPATLVVILDEMLTSMSVLAKRFAEEPKHTKPSPTLKAKTQEIHIEDIEAWHKGGREQYWPRTSLTQFTTIVRMVEKFYKASQHGY
jgi:hypothetical protein